ncbi:MAG: hypothetical protein N3F64_03675 [Nitrososphaeria archaeon]|nr:hypothetical protein [Nitrososphaeria archaeon]
MKKEKNSRLSKILPIVAGISSFTILYFLNFEIIFSLALTGFITAFATLPLVYKLLAKRLPRASIDESLLFTIIQMYAVSTGKPSRNRILEIKTLVGDYGEFQSILSKFSTLSTNWGYGLVRAIQLLAKNVKNTIFRNFLLRLSEVLRVGEDPENYLELEARMHSRLYEYNYSRSLDFARVLLGLYSSVMSASAFIIITLALLSMFMGGDTILLIVSIIGSVSITIFFGIFIILIMPKDWTILYGAIKPYYRKKYFLITLTAVTASLIIFFITQNFLGFAQSYGLLFATLPLFIPGIYALIIEDRIKKVSNVIPVFARSFGMTYSVLQNQQKAIESTLQGELGPLRRFIENLRARLSTGIDPKIGWRHACLDTCNKDFIHLTNILNDTMDVNGNTATVGIFLSDYFTVLNNMRVSRLGIARTFESTIYMLHALLVAISSALMTILNIFSEYYKTMMEMMETSAETFSMITEFPIRFFEIDVNLVANLLFTSIIVLAIMNAIVLKIVFGGLVETFWTHVATLFTLTSIAWVVMEILSRQLVIPVIV